MLMRPPHPPPSPLWIPLGSAQLFDWKQLERPSSAPGATAWVARLGPETLLIRTWCKESTTFFEFFFLTRPELNGTMVVLAERPEHTRLRLRITLEADGVLNYTEECEYAEHPRTGLYGQLTRKTELVEGQLSLPTSPNAVHAEIFEYAPESALHTDAGTWIFELFAAMLRGLDAEAAPPAPAPSLVDPIPSPHPIQSTRGPSLPREQSVPKQVVAPAPVSPDSQPSRLPPMTISTNSGEQWEVTDDETYIGRSKQCTIVLKSQRVSRKHASITREADGYYINDLGAANGIWAGTEKINRERIVSGAEYIIGDVLLAFHY